MNFYTPKVTREKTARSFALMAPELCDEFVVSDTAFWEHIGRKPKGNWSLHRVAEDHVVWVPRGVDPDQWLRHNKPPFKALTVKMGRPAHNTPVPTLLSDTYLLKLYNSGKVSRADFVSFEDFCHTIGPRPSKDHTLTSTDDPYLKTPESITRQTYVWVTKSALQAAREKAVVEPPIVAPEGLFDAARDSEELAVLKTKALQRQALNNTRFARLVQPIITKAKPRVAYYERQKENEAKLSLLLDKINDYVASKGYNPATQAFDPSILPAATHPKFNEARKLATKLMRENTWTYSQWLRRQSLDALNKQKRADRTKTVAYANRIHTGRRGRPVEKFIKARVPISTLTPEQRVAVGLGPDQHFTYYKDRANRMRKSFTVEAYIPNPKLDQSAQDTAGTT